MTGVRGIVFFLAIVTKLCAHAQSEAMQLYMAEYRTWLQSGLNTINESDCECPGIETFTEGITNFSMIQIGDETYEVSPDARLFYMMLESLQPIEKCSLMQQIANIDIQAASYLTSKELVFSVSDFSLSVSALHPRYIGSNTQFGIMGLEYLPAVKYGLEIDSVYDERLHYGKTACAATAYLNHLHQCFEAWSLAIAAYHWGPSTVQRHVEAGTTHQVNMAPFDALIACIVFTNNYLGYLKDHKLAFNQNYDTVRVSARMHLEQAAHFLKIEKQQILEINPAVLSDVIYGDMKPRRLILPESYGVVFTEKADSIIAFTDSIYFSKPEKPSFAENKIAYTIPGNDYEKISYTIQSGDNLGLIAEKFNVKINDLRDWNDISGNTIYAGKTLIIYVKKGSSLESNAAGIQPNNPAPKGEPSILQGYILFDTYVVKKGDSPYTIAAQYPGVSAENIMEWNNISNPSKIQIGQTLKIYKKR